MKNRIDKTEADKWARIAAKFKTAHDAIGDAHLILLLELGVTDGKPLETILRALDSVAYAYEFTPQTEWTGGDSMNPDNFKINNPHIAR